jgi:hypothetical protein
VLPSQLLARHCRRMIKRQLLKLFKRVREHTGVDTVGFLGFHTRDEVVVIEPAFVGVTKIYICTLAEILIPPTSNY